MGIEKVADRGGALMASEPADLDGQVETAPMEQSAQHAPEVSREFVNALMLKQAKWPSKAPPPNVLLDLIRRLSRERKIGFLNHADMRLAQRGFDIFDVHSTLENGYFKGGIEAGANQGEWKIKVVDVPEGTSRKNGRSDHCG
jgi:hypothetical protein